jgi:hypothetical protein
LLKRIAGDCSESEFDNPMTQKKITKRNLPGAPICGAKLRKRDGLCQSKVLYPNGRCKLHGGPTPNGIASPAFKHGQHIRYWRYFEGLGLLDLAERALKDQVDVKDSTDAMVLMQLRVFSLLEGKKPNDELDDAWLKLKAISRGTNPKATRDAFLNFDELMGKRKEPDWEGAIDLEERLDRFRDRHFKRDVDAQRLIHVETVMGLYSAIIKAFKEVLFEVCDEAGRPDLYSPAIWKIHDLYVRFLGRKTDAEGEAIEVEPENKEEG